VPYIVHEANAKPGLANRWGARFTPYVATSVADQRLPHGVPLGIPLRRAVSLLDRPAMRAEARAHFGLLPDAPTLLVSGGSQGARSINRAAVAASADLLGAGVQVLHVAGPTQIAEVQADAPTRDEGVPPYVVLGYVDAMELAYAAADLMLCRAGAMTCAELSAVGLPAVYVPLPHGNGEQRFNAAPIVDAGGGIMLADADLRPAWIRDTLVPLLTDPARLAQMSSHAAELGHRDADDRLVDMVFDAVRAGVPS
jgi:UDP-N-acetylglucosamine--N-acetylmuramyl-(pentapeptide) pyrophosphoryl-undecaprenol N-acetylglucosamine transferase